MTVREPMTTPKRRSAQTVRITVLAGGPSAERSVSLKSGAAIAGALRRRGFCVTVADIGPGDLSALEIEADLIFPALHGPFGEDGALQSILEARGARFVGSGSAASALAMNKVATKQRVIALAADTPEYEVVRPGATVSLAPPVVVKPNNQGSSVATTIVRDRDELPAALALVHASFGDALVERFIVGDELTVGLLGDRNLPPICIRPKRAFYDFAAKYEVDDTEYLFEAGYPPELLERVSRQSRAIFAALGCRHLARLDWMIDESYRPWFLEVNTLPGFTDHSLVPKAAARVGLSFDDVCERLALMALEGVR